MTTRTKDLFIKPNRVALISIHPCFVEKILTGEKRLEFRRIWAVQSLDMLLIYSTSPIQRIVASVNIVNVTKGTPTSLWELAKDNRGGVTRQLIYDYFEGKKTGYAIEMANVIKFKKPVDPKKILTNFFAPQSFRYLAAGDYKKILKESNGAVA